MKAILRVAKLSPAIAVKKIFRFFFDKLKNSVQFKSDSQRLTFSPNTSAIQSIHYHIFPLPEAEHLKHFDEQITTSAALSVIHKFDLLGSGITHVYNGMQAEGMLGTKYLAVEGYSDIDSFVASIENADNRKFSQALSKMITNDYKLIDWQIDFKSGFRWSHNTWSKKISYGQQLGADIKVPWELGRLQHLITLSLAYYLEKSSGKTAKSEHFSKEFCNQIIDFRLSNPPRFGTQWMSAMDVSIRAVNLLVSYSYFKQAGCQFDKQFESMFVEMILEHSQFVQNNLEWSSGMRGNHYLAGISALIIISAYLPSSEATDGVLARSLDILLREIDYQFNSDGSNFEGSVSYHRFSFEMVLYGLFTVLSLPEMRRSALSRIKSKSLKYTINGEIEISDALLSKLFKMLQFLLFCSTKSHYLPQFGDSDSGYFIHITPFYFKYLAKRVNRKDYFFHSSNNPWNAISLFVGYFSDFIDVPILSRYNEFHAAKVLRSKSKIDFNLSLLSQLSEEVNRYLLRKYSKENYRAKSFPDFGLYSVWRKKYHFVFNLGKIGQKGKGGHNHNDALSFELYKGDIPIIVNGGTYCYTPFPARRNAFRSVNNHNTVAFNGLEQNLWSEGSKDDLFWLAGDRTKPKMNKFSDKGLIAEHCAYTQKLTRKISFTSNAIYFIDECKLQGKRKVLLHFVPGTNIIINGDAALIDYKNIKLEIPKGDFNFYSEAYQYSAHYGLLQNSYRLVIESESSQIEWLIKIY